MDESRWLPRKTGRGSSIDAVKMAAKRVRRGTCDAMNENHSGMRILLFIGEGSEDTHKPNGIRLYFFFYGILKSCPDILSSTSCLQSGSECVYPSQGDETPCISNAVAVYGGSPVSMKTEVFVNYSLNDYVGGIFDSLPDSSKTLLRHCKWQDIYTQSAPAQLKYKCRCRLLGPRTATC